MPQGNIVSSIENKCMPTSCMFIHEQLEQPQQVIDNLLLTWMLLYLPWSMHPGPQASQKKKKINTKQHRT